VTNIEQARLTWIKERPQYEAFGRVIEERLKSILRPFGIWFEVTSRAKAIDSLVKKLLRDRGASLETLPDKVGARVIIRYRSDIDRLIEGVRPHFDSELRDDKVKELGTDRVGYQSIHLDKVRLRGADQNVSEFPPAKFWAEVQVRTLAQHLWSEMTHDSFYKNDAMLSELTDDVRRRVNLMSGQVEVADREFDRLNSELSSQGAMSLWRALEKHYYTFASRRPDRELSAQVIKTFLPLVENDLAAFTRNLDDFLNSKRKVLEHAYEGAEKEPEGTTAFIFQPEVLFLYDLLSFNPEETRRIWNRNYPEPELERIANVFGISFD
jgi:ppGpp synthetase/RelA/SpoT-type nucleotidyltranferase